MKRKQLALGLEQLSHEGVIQLFRPSLGRQDAWLGAVVCCSSRCSRPAWKSTESRSP